MHLIQAHKNTLTGKDFLDNDKICVDAITGELLRILGEEATETIFSFVERRHKIPRNQSLAKIGDFNRSLELILGKGATIIETQILKELQRKIEL